MLYEGDPLTAIGGLHNNVYEYLCYLHSLAGEQCTYALTLQESYTWGLGLVFLPGGGAIPQDSPEVLWGNLQSTLATMGATTWS